MDQIVSLFLQKFNGRQEWTYCLLLHRYQIPISSSFTVAQWNLYNGLSTWTNHICPSANSAANPSTAPGHTTGNVLYCNFLNVISQSLSNLLLKTKTFYTVFWGVKKSEHFAALNIHTTCTSLIKPSTHDIDSTHQTYQCSKKREAKLALKAASTIVSK